MAVINANLAPIINTIFYVTGAWGEPRTSHIHAGVDLSSGLRSAVYSMYDGVVLYVDSTGSSGSGYGPYIIIKSDDGYAWLYGDLQSFSGYVVGQRVLRGQQISYEGNPGGTSSTGYHVHVEKEYLGSSNTYRYGYEYTMDPTIDMGINNVVSYTQQYYYDGIPVPPVPIKKRNKFPWVLYARKFRARNH